MSSIASEPAAGTAGAGAPTIASIVDGVARGDAPGGRLTSTNPANTSEVVAEVAARRRVHVRRRRARRAGGAEGVGRRSRSGPRPRDRAGRPPRRGQQGGAGRGSSRARSASRTPRRWARCRRSSTPATSSSARAGACTGRPSRRRCPNKQLFTFRMPVGVAAIITAGNFPVAVPAWYLVPAILCGNAVVWKPAEYSAALGDALAKLFHAGGVPGRRPEPRAGVGRRHVRGPRGRRWTRAWSTRSASPGPARSARRSASSAGATCSRRASSSAARTRWS